MYNLAYNIHTVSEGDVLMNTNFPRTLSLLRKEKQLSQRSVAKALGVSQAVLSHYENGLREPGLEFVAKAADFYKVSCDFLLGRTMSREDYTIKPEDIPDMSEKKDNVLRGSMLAAISKKLIVNSVSLIFDIVGKSKSKKLIGETAMFFNVAVYKIFRTLYSACGKNSEELFSINENVWRDLANAELMQTSYNINCAARNIGAEEEAVLPELSPEYIAAEYAALNQSVMSVLQAAGKRLEEKK